MAPAEGQMERDQRACTGKERRWYQGERVLKSWLSGYQCLLHMHKEPLESPVHVLKDSMATCAPVFLML